ncbi:phage minor capsid protein [Nonomuraea polychroma]|uniref:phage minor capsid protein n=1 Tax=Nonomuraea polychroma TaxID=46176 RepID=UPI003D8D4D10
MAITPAGAIEAGLEQARLIAAMYADAETALLERIAARVGKDLDNDDGQDWANKRLAEVTQLRKEAESIVRRLEAAAKAAAQRAVLDTWAEGMDAAVRGAVLQVADAKLRRRLARVLQDARNLGAKRGISAGQGVAELAAQAVTLVTSVHEGALRAVDDIYRNVVAETAGRVLVGAETRREAAQWALDRFTQQGITGFTDSASPPRTWNMASYVEMAMRTATARAAVDGHLSTLREAGINLVSVSRLPYTCSRCAPWEGEVLALSGAAGTRVEENPATGVQVFVQVAGTVAEARLAGLMHPNCGHNLSAYLPGVSRPAPVVQSKTTYADAQRQRYLERKIRENKRRAAVSLDDGARAKAAAKTDAYQQQLKELTKATGLRRKTSREKADAPPEDLEKLTDKQLAEQASKFSDDEQAMARLEQETKRRDAEAEAAEKAAKEAEREAAESPPQEQEWQPPLHPFSTKQMTRDDVVRQMAEWIRIALRDRYGIDHAKATDQDIIDVWDELRRENEPGTFGASVFEAAERFEDRMANNKTPFYRLVYRSVRRGDRAIVPPPDSGQKPREEPREEPPRQSPAKTDDPIAALRQIHNINELSDDDVMALMERYQNDDDGMSRLLDELDRIERETRDVWSWNWREEETDADRRISELIASGRYSYMEAYAEVHGLDPAELDRQERRALLEAERRPGEDIDQTVRRLYAQQLDQWYDQAEQATNGFMLNAEGRAAGISERSLFSGLASRARKYASEELLRWWADNPRLTLTEFRAMWLNRDSDRRAATQIRAGAAGREFGV